MSTSCLEYNTRLARKINQYNNKFKTLL
jgi:hypothetical protein